MPSTQVGVTTRPSGGEEHRSHRNAVRHDDRPSARSTQQPPTAQPQQRLNDSTAAAAADASVDPQGGTLLAIPAIDVQGILAQYRMQPGPGTYELPSLFDDPKHGPRRPVVTLRGSARNNRFIDDVDLFAAAKGPGPGQYFTSRSFQENRLRRPKLPMERFHAGSYFVNLPLLPPRR